MLSNFSQKNLYLLRFLIELIGFVRFKYLAIYSNYSKYNTYLYEICHLEADQLKYYYKVDIMSQSFLLLVYIGIKSTLEGFVIS